MNVKMVFLLEENRPDEVSLREKEKMSFFQEKRSTILLISNAFSLL